ncbi:hypothetical protein B7R21_12360 [Subtercola boreus]|uniref:Polymerase nucleotidyl transferase domain-containing protein n=1 Tax=Subtercola boreus TaxID=120213 RepID=A0A3E0VP98_9MICO|nr:nucleotidyltransferase domain-containing protein [Subtercola boreus]RFA11495.1 hypothetical protein B7R21_12360 [Subtercola boreus]
MRLQNPFAVIDTTGLDSQILAVVTRSEQYLTVRQICALLPEGGSSQGVRKSVARLKEQGTILERVTGRSFAYALNPDHLLVDAIRQIANAKRALLARMAAAISIWHIQPITVKVFGLAARDEMRTDSDIDLLVVMPDTDVGDAGETLVRELTAQMTRWTGNDVRPLLYRSSEVRSADIFESIVREGIDVYGDPSWLRRQIRKDRGEA